MIRPASRAIRNGSSDDIAAYCGVSAEGQAERVDEALHHPAAGGGLRLDDVDGAVPVVRDVMVDDDQPPAAAAAGWRSPRRSSDPQSNVSISSGSAGKSSGLLSRSRPGSSR